MHIVVSGYSGVGKTSWAHALAKTVGGHAGAEVVDTASLFRLAETSGERAHRVLAQLGFLMTAAEQHTEAAGFAEPYFQDHSVYEVAEVYTTLLTERHHLEPEHASLVHEVYEIARRALPAPQAVLHLQASPDAIRSRILLRGRTTDLLPDVQEISQLVIRRRQLWASLGFPVMELDTTTMPIPLPNTRVVRDVWSRLQRFVHSHNGAVQGKDASTQFDKL